MSNDDPKPGADNELERPFMLKRNYPWRSADADCTLVPHLNQANAMDEVLQRLRKALAGRYTVERLIGRGGMSLVYLARDMRNRRNVALKVLRPDLAKSIGAKRFLSEIKIAANLEHPHILPLFDSGEADGSLYYTMPFVEGESLRDLLKREGQLSVNYAVHIAREVAEALANAHDHGVVHRDIKPENILLTGGIARVADFGIARARTEAGYFTSTTNANIAVGTPEYMSPEQASGSDAVDGRTDIYSLGCVLYEMLAGEPPFTGRTAHAIIAKHLNERIPSIEVVRPDMAPEIIRVIETALAKVPADRFNTMGELCASLELDKLSPPRGIRSGGHGRAVPTRRGARVGYFALLAVILLVGVYAIVSRKIGVQAGGEGEVPWLVVLTFENQGEVSDDLFAAGISDEVTSRLADVSGIGVIARYSAMQYEEEEHSIRTIARELDVDFVLHGAVRTDRAIDGATMVRVVVHLTRARDSRVVWTNRYDAAHLPGQMFEVQSEIAEGVAGALNVQLLPNDLQAIQARATISLNAYDAFQRGNLFSSQFLVADALRRAIEMYEQAVRIDPTFALAYARLAQSTSMYYYFFDRSDSRLRRAMLAVDSAFALDSTLPEAQVALGYYHYWGDLDYERAMEHFETVRSRQPNNSELMWVIGSVQRRQGKWTDALSSFIRAYRLEPRSHMFAFEVGGTYHLLSRFAEGATYYEQARLLAPDWVPASASLALLHLASEGDVARANAILHELTAQSDIVTGIIPVLLGETSYRPIVAVMDETFQAALDRFTLDSATADSGSFHILKAMLYERRNQDRRARTHFDSARVVWEGRVRARPMDPGPRIELGIAYAGLGQYLRATAQADSAAVLRPIERDALRGGVWAMELARLYSIVGRSEDAIELLARLLQVPSPATVAGLRVDPTFSALQQHPRFQEILESPQSQ